MRDGAPSLDINHPRCGLSKFLQTGEGRKTI